MVWYHLHIFDCWSGKKYSCFAEKVKKGNINGSHQLTLYNRDENSVVLVSISPSHPTIRSMEPSTKFEIECVHRKLTTYETHICHWNNHIFCERNQISKAGKAHIRINKVIRNLLFLRFVFVLFVEMLRHTVIAVNELSNNSIGKAIRKRRIKKQKKWKHLQCLEFLQLCTDERARKRSERFGLPIWMKCFSWLTFIDFSSFIFEISMMRRDLACAKQVN